MRVLHNTGDGQNGFPEIPLESVCSGAHTLLINAPQHANLTYLRKKKGQNTLSFTRHEALKLPCFRHAFSSSGNSFNQIQIVTNLLCPTSLYYLYEELNLENILARTGEGLFKDNYKKKLAHFRHLIQHRNINGTSL